MLEPENKSTSERDRELFLGHIVTWGAIIAGLVIAIALAPMVAAEKDQRDPTPTAETTPDRVTSGKG